MDLELPRSHNLGYKIGVHKFNFGLSLAPMAGNTNLAYRALCRKFGAELTTTEMVSSMALRHNDNKSLSYLAKAANETPVAAQIFGADPETLAMAAQSVEQRGFHFVDLNVGCPVPKITGCGGGSALMREPNLAAECISAMVKATNIPVTVKIRAGWNDHHKNAPEFAAIMQDSGAQAITIHGRTREQKYTGCSDLSLITEVAAAVTIPVIGNGDVTDIKSAQAMADTKVNGIAIGRGALGKPWLFDQLSNYFSGNNVPDDPGPETRSKLLIELGQGVCELYGEQRGMRVMRRLAADFFHGLPGAPQFRKQCGQLSTLQDLDTVALKLSDISY
ncbi:MAG: tRNA dihydrouridine synthase DusB [Planctomycetes bacterium]|nr:tRNA dihydrouridine synthase DusB [Planctomycetota bacterium]